MNDPRSVDTTPLNPPGPDRQAHLTQLEGREARPDQDGAFAEEDVEATSPPTDTEIYEGDLEALGGAVAEPGTAPVDELTTLGLRAGETADAGVAAEEGETWVPPVDPPVVADRDAPGGIEVAAGFGTTAEDEPFDADHRSGDLPADDELTDRIRQALVADARTSHLASRVEVDADGGVVRILGEVDDIDDGDLLASVAAEVSGVVSVRDETEPAGL